MNDRITLQRAKLISMAETFIGAPYIWWAKGKEVGALINNTFVKSPSSIMCFDCSGFVTYLLKEVTGVDIRWEWNTDKFWNSLPSVTIPQPGDVALYGGRKENGAYVNNDVSHIELVYSVDGAGVQVIGASGGDQRTVSFQVSNAQNAKVSRKLSHVYRRDFRGFRDMTSLL